MEQRGSWWMCWWACWWTCGTSFVYGDQFDPQTAARATSLAQTLPGQTVRLRVVPGSQTGDSGWDEDGKESPMGIKVHVQGVRYVVDVGWTDSWMVSVVVPQVISNKVIFDEAAFQGSAVYQKEYARLKAGILAKLLSLGVCSNEADCEGRFSRGLGVDVDLTLPTGEMQQIPAGTPLSGLVKHWITNGGRPVDGATGWGDVELVTAYQLVRSGPVHWLLAASLRWPTGSFTDVPLAERPTGGGIQVLGGRSIADWILGSGVHLAWDYGVEYPLSKGVRKKSSLLHVGALNEADPTSEAAVTAGGDGLGNEQTYEVHGLRHKGRVVCRYALGLLHEVLEPWAVMVGANYDVFPSKTLHGRERPVPAAGPKGYRVDGLGQVSMDFWHPYGVPLRLEWEHGMPYMGQNVPLAGSYDVVSMQFFYRF